MNEKVDHLLIDENKQLTKIQQIHGDYPEDF
jgi:hypothetical protein